MCAASAIAIVLALFLARLRAHGTRVADPSDAALATRVARIPADRDSRMGRGSR
jgi:hypothetical protein